MKPQKYFVKEKGCCSVEYAQSAQEAREKWGKRFGKKVRRDISAVCVSGRDEVTPYVAL